MSCSVSFLNFKTQIAFWNLYLGFIWLEEWKSGRIENWEKIEK